MPKKYYNGEMHGHKYGDIQWISEQIDKLPIGMQDDVDKKYSDIYESLSGENLQRFRSNTWLRAVVVKHAIEVDENDIMF